MAKGCDSSGDDVFEGLMNYGQYVNSLPVCMCVLFGMVRRCLCVGFIKRESLCLLDVGGLCGSR